MPAAEPKAAAEAAVAATAGEAALTNLMNVEATGVEAAGVHVSAPSPRGQLPGSLAPVRGRPHAGQGRRDLATCTGTSARARRFPNMERFSDSA